MVHLFPVVEEVGHEAATPTRAACHGVPEPVWKSGDCVEGQRGGEGVGRGNRSRHGEEDVWIHQ